MLVIKKSIPNGKCCLSLTIILIGHRQKKYFSLGACRLNYFSLFSFSRKDWVFVGFGLVLNRAFFSSGDKYSVLSGTAIFSNLFQSFLLCFQCSFYFYGNNLYSNGSESKKSSSWVGLRESGCKTPSWCLTYVILFFFLLSAVLERSVINCHFPAWISCFVYLPVIFISLLSTPGAHKCLNYVFSLLAPVMLYFMKEDTWRGSLV